MFRRMQHIGLILVVAAAAVCAFADPAPDELEPNRRKLEFWRKHPEQLARLRQDLQAFQALPAERREKIIQLDHDIHQEPATTRARLWNSMQRYTDWVERLSDQERQAIKQAPNKTARLALIRDLRDQIWMRSRPKAERETWEELQGDARLKYVRGLRQEARQRHQQWLIASRFWRELEHKQPLPCRLGEFSERVQKYVNDYLLMMLSDAEKQQLVRAEGRWPDYPQALVEIAGKHPSALPSPTRELPRHVDQLPAPIRQRVTLEKKGLAGKKSFLLPKLLPFDDSPSFASKVVEFGTKEGKQPFEFEFWACNFKSLQPPMKDFVERKLIPALADNADKKKLTDNEGRWPFYPLEIQLLSQKHSLTPPWHILPDADKYKWDSYRPSRPPSEPGHDAS